MICSCARPRFAYSLLARLFGAIVGCDESSQDIGIKAEPSFQHYRLIATDVYVA